MKSLATFTCTTDRGVVAYTQLERPLPEEPDVIAGGLLGGDPQLVELVRTLLAGGPPERVCVAEPNVYYQFSAGRDTLADVAAAMLVVGGGRGQLSDRGLDELAAAVADEDDDRAGGDAAPPPADEGAVIH